jgi:erythromycin esterase-like protein
VRGEPAKIVVWAHNSHLGDARATEVGSREFLLWFDLAPPAADVLRAARLERVIGVIYRPQTERQSHYFQARVAALTDWGVADATHLFEEPGALQAQHRVGQGTG